MNVPRACACAVFAALAAVVPCAAQVTPAAPDMPSIKVGVLIFADYTVNQQPTIKDADGRDVTLSAFQIGRSYINVTGAISRTITFRVTPDITRETGLGSSLNGSYTFRLKAAFVQWNLDQHLTKGSSARFGMQPTPWIEFFDSVYRYRFQGPTFEDREGYLFNTDVGASFRFMLPGEFGDVQAAVFNGEGYSHAEVNGQKGVELRGTLRPFAGHALARGLRFTVFVNHDAYQKDAERRRVISGVTFEHAHVHAGVDYLAASDRTSVARSLVHGRGWTAFVTPITGHGWEGLLRVDHLEPNTALGAQTRQRTIAGVSYWFPHQGSVATALLFDVDTTSFHEVFPPQPTQRKFALHALISY